jgi:hypothetical protein
MSDPVTVIHFLSDGTMKKSLRWPKTTQWTPTTNALFFSKENVCELSSQGKITQLKCWLPTIQDKIYPFGMVPASKIGDIVTDELMTTLGPAKIYENTETHHYECVLPVPSYAPIFVQLV